MDLEELVTQTVELTGKLELFLFSSLRIHICLIQLPSDMEVTHTSEIFLDTCARIELSIFRIKIQEYVRKKVADDFLNRQNNEKS